jgi:amidohydrolase
VVSLLSDRGLSPSAASLNWADELTAAIGRRFEKMCTLRRHLHQNPEPSGEEVETTRYLASLLESEHLTPVIAEGGRGLWVDIGCGTEGAAAASHPRIGIRADMDALWITDEKSTANRSNVKGVMHACGHDAHSAVVFGAIATLAELIRSEALPWPVACRAIFQPAEETNRGALDMIKAGALEGLSDLIGLHVDPSRMVGTIGLRHGDFTADCHEVEIEVHGRGAHAARPHEAIDPVAITAQLISSIYLFVPRSTDSQDPVVITFGQILGGHAPNAIPDHVIVRGTLRTLDSEVSQATIHHIERLTRGLADASQSQISVRWQSGPPPVKNDPELVSLLLDSARSVVGERQVQTIRRPSMGGEDFANYLFHVRGAMFRLGCVAEPIGAPPLHSPLFDIDERALRVGAELLSHVVIRWCDPKYHPSTAQP